MAHCVYFDQVDKLQLRRRLVNCHSHDHY